MENVYKVVMKLIVRPLDPSDFGEYKCVGKNALGESEKTVVLYREYTILLGPLPIRFSAKVTISFSLNLFIRQIENG